MGAAARATKSAACCCSAACRAPSAAPTFCLRPPGGGGPARGRRGRRCRPPRVRRHERGEHLDLAVKEDSALTAAAGEVLVLTDVPASFVMLPAFAEAAAACGGIARPPLPPSGTSVLALRRWSPSRAAATSRRYRTCWCGSPDLRFVRLRPVPSGRIITATSPTSCAGARRTRPRRCRWRARLTDGGPAPPCAVQQPPDRGRGSMTIRSSSGQSSSSPNGRSCASAPTAGITGWRRGRTRSRAG